jgi:hypothetical protein
MSNFIDLGRKPQETKMKRKSIKKVVKKSKPRRVKMAKKEVDKKEVEKEEVKEVNENILRKNSGHLNLEEK